MTWCHPVERNDTTVAVDRNTRGSHTGSHSRQRDVPDDARHTQRCPVSSYSSVLFFSPSNLPGRSSYYFLQNAMGGDVCSGNSSHVPDKVTIPSPTFRQRNMKVEKKHNLEMTVCLKRTKQNHVCCHFPLSHSRRVQVSLHLWCLGLFLHLWRWSLCSWAFMVLPCPPLNSWGSVLDQNQP